VYEHEKDLVIELAAPGVAKDELDVDLWGDLLVISGVRTGETLSNGKQYRHAEIPRGSFRRAMLLPAQTSGPPRIELKDGIVQIRLARGSTTATAPKAKA
jgi:HSP20 family protein